MINFTIYGIPVPKGRPRFFRKGNFVGTYTDKKTKQGEYDFKMQALKYKPDQPLTGGLKMDIHIYVKMPKTFSALYIAKAESGFILPVKRPDIDNFVKLALDSMNGIFFVDDAQVVDMNCIKRYSVRPRITIILQEV